MYEERSDSMDEIRSVWRVEQNIEELAKVVFD